MSEQKERRGEVDRSVDGVRRPVIRAEFNEDDDLTTQESGEFIDHPIHLDETTLSSDLQFIGRIFTVETRSVRLPDGRQSRREIVHHPGGACVLALDSDGNMYLVRQYRVGVDAPLRELPAGKLEPDEDPLTCARRELKEETGIVADRWDLLTSFFPSPGYDDECITIYLARGLTGGIQELDEGEFLSVEKISLQQAVTDVLTGRISDGKTCLGTLITAMLLERGEL